MIVFRADGNKTIGAGHVMRCLSIADAARERGIESCFIMADNSFEEVIGARRYKCFVLDTDYSDMNSELPKLEWVMKQVNSTYIIVDSYHVTKKYFSVLQRYGKVGYIDDMMDSAYPVDDLINYNIYSSEMCYRHLYTQSRKKPPKFLLGTRYVPLRKEFQNTERKQIQNSMTKIFVSTGGADIEHVALNLIRFLRSDVDTWNNYEFHFVLGMMNTDINEIKEASEKSFNVILHYDVKNMRELMMQCDVAISAAGSTLYELCACGIPTITYVLADNQLQAERVFVENRIMESIGDIRKCGEFSEHVFDKLKYLDMHYERRQEMSMLSKSVIDGNGAMNIVDELQIEH